MKKYNVQIGDYVWFEGEEFFVVDEIDGRFLINRSVTEPGQERRVVVNREDLVNERRTV